MCGLVYHARLFLLQETKTQCLRLATKGKDTSSVKTELIFTCASYARRVRLMWQVKNRKKKIHTRIGERPALSRGRLWVGIQKSRWTYKTLSLKCLYCCSDIMLELKNELPPSSPMQNPVRVCL